MCTHAYAHIHTQMHDIHTHACICTHAKMHIHMCIHTHACACAQCSYTYIYVDIPSTFTHRHKHLQTYKHTTHTCMCTTSTRTPAHKRVRAAVPTRAVLPRGVSEKRGRGTTDSPAVRTLHSEQPKVACIADLL